MQNTQLPADLQSALQKQNIQPLYLSAAIILFELDVVNSLATNDDRLFKRSFSGFSLWYYRNSGTYEMYFSEGELGLFTFRSIKEIKDQIVLLFDADALQNEKLNRAVLLMRNAQKKYFSTRSKNALAESKRLEQGVDAMITAHYEPNTQNLLF